MKPILFIIIFILAFSCGSKSENKIEKKIKVELKEIDSNLIEAEVTRETIENGKTTTNKKVFTGTKAEVTAKIDRLEQTASSTSKVAKNKQKIEVKMETNADGTVTATVTSISINANGKEVINEEEFTGSLKEVTAKIETYKE